MLDNLLPSNERHLQSLLSLITESGQSEVVILGMTFKSNTDDLRESAMVEVAQTLLGRGFKLRIYDPALNSLGARGREQARHRHEDAASGVAMLCPDLKTAL